MPNSKNILIVINDAITAFDLKIELTELGHHVIGIASNPNSALKFINNQHIDFALIDFNLQNNNDGILFAEYLYFKHHLPHIYIGGDHNISRINKCIHTKPLGYISKPFTREDIKQIINSAIHNLNRSTNPNPCHFLKKEPFIITFNNKGHVISYNNKAASFLGYSHEKMNQLSYHSIFPLKQPESIKNYLSTFNNKDNFFFRSEISCSKKIKTRIIGIAQKLHLKNEILYQTISYPDHVHCNQLGIINNRTLINHIATEYPSLFVSFNKNNINAYATTEKNI